MTDTLYQQVKSQITTREAAERYGYPVTRGGMARCAFHNDRHPSMKVDRRYYCFTCHATGDVIDFTAKIFGLTPYRAARKLAEDFGIRPLPPGQSAPLPVVPPELAQRREEQRMAALLVDYEKLLRQWQEAYAPSPAKGERWDPHFAHAVCHLKPVGYAIERLTSADPEERREMLEALRRTGAGARAEIVLQQGIEDIMKEGNDGGKDGESAKDRAA